MRKPIFRRRSGEGTPMILAIVLVLLMLFCAIAEFSRLWIIAQGVKEAAQQAVISTVNDNYDDVYHAVREGYAAGWYPDGTGRWDESIDTGDVYGQLSETLGLENTAGGYQKISDGEVEYTISDLSVVLENNSLGSGQSEGYTALVEIHLVNSGNNSCRGLSIPFPQVPLVASRSSIFMLPALRSIVDCLKGGVHLPSSVMNSSLCEGKYVSYPFLLQNS